MKTLLRNRKTVFYALPTGKERLTDAYGNYTGETVQTYADPVRYDRLSGANPAGAYKTEPYGIVPDYTETYVTTDLCCPITADTRLWIGVCPYDRDDNLRPYTHLVRRVLRTINVIRIEVDEVSVS